MSRPLAIFALVLGEYVAGADAPMAASVPALSQAEAQAWTRFADAWNLAQDSTYSSGELRTLLTGVSAAEVAWVLAEREFNENVLAASHWSAEHLLLEAPRLRLAGRLVAEVASIEYLTPSTLIAPPERDPDDPLWGETRRDSGRLGVATLPSIGEGHTVASNRARPRRTSVGGDIPHSA